MEPAEARPSSVVELLKKSIFSRDSQREPAVVGPCLNDSLSYNGLSRKVDLILAEIHGAIGECGPFFGAVCIDRSVEMVLGCVSIVLSGGTYVAVHPNDPQRRQEVILSDTKPAVIVTVDEFKNDLTSMVKRLDLPSKVISISSLHHTEDQSSPITVSFFSPEPSSAVYCPYTSGSTGAPKGILLSHRALCHFMFSLREYELQQGVHDPFGPGCRVLQLARSSFDIHFFEIIGPLCFGGTTVLLPSAESPALASKRLLEYLVKLQVTWSFMVPAVAHQLIRALTEALTAKLEISKPLELQALYIGGEAPTIRTFNDLSSLLTLYGAVTNDFKRTRLVNAYGPAECTIFSLLHEFDPNYSYNDHIPLGKPIPGYQIRLETDDDSGEASLLIGGPAILSEYLHRPDETSNALVPQSGALWYKSGDFVRKTASGEIVFIGRRDAQVKVRGQRLELSEIEVILLKDVRVFEAVVTVFRPKPDLDILVAYIEPQDELLDGKQDFAAVEKELVDICRQHLAPWMIPSAFVFLPNGLPRNSNGKIDRNSLPNPTQVEKIEAQIAIIGGGVAGMIAAIACQERGLSYRIFESCNALGGVWINGASNIISRLQQPFEYYQLDRETEVPKIATTGLPWRFPDTPSLVEYFGRIDSKYRISTNTFFSTRVLSVSSTKEENIETGSLDQVDVCLEAMDLNSLAIKRYYFGAVICATGRFHPNRSVVPDWAHTSSPMSPVRIVQARELSSTDLKDKKVVIIGGGPYAVESVRMAVENGANRVTLLTRAPRWVFPRSWFDPEHRALMRLFWKLFSGLSVAPGIVQLARITLARRYVHAGIAHMIPVGLPFTNPQTAISDEFFEYAKLPHVEMVRGVAQRLVDSNPEIGSASLEISDLSGSTRTLCGVDTIVLACGFSPPKYDFLESITPNAEMYLGSVLLQNPKVCFVGVGLGDGVFPNPHTARLQTQMVLNHLQYPESCRRSLAERQRWVSSMAPLENGDPRGSNAHLAEIFTEIRWQTHCRSQFLKKEHIQTAKNQRLSAPTITSVESIVKEVSLIVLGEKIPLTAPLLYVGMDSIRAIEFRSRLLDRFGENGIELPSVATLLWDLPTLSSIVEHIVHQMNKRISSAPNTETHENGDESEDYWDESIEPMLTRAEAIAYIEQQLGISNPLARLAEDSVQFITDVATEFVKIVPFQSFSILVTDRCNRLLPNFSEIKRDVLARIGGCCYTMNVFMLELLKAIGISTYYARCNIHGVEDCHVTVMIRNLQFSPSIWILDVGCGYITPKPICLTFDGKESPEYQHGFLKFKFVRDLEPNASSDTIWRLHANESTFEQYEKTLKRSDGFDHVFWRMSTRPRPLHDRGEREQFRAFVCFHKLRSAIAVGPNARMVYFKAENDRGRLHSRVLIDSDQSTLQGIPLSRKRLLQMLVEYFPRFPIRALVVSIDKLGCTFDEDGSPFPVNPDPQAEIYELSKIRISNRISMLYPTQKSDLLLQRITDVVEKWRKQVKLSLASEALPCTASALFGAGFTEKDVVLIAYPNHLKQTGIFPLHSLSDWCYSHLKSLVSLIHVLPFHPSTAYDGYGVTDYFAVDPGVGTWAEMTRFGELGFKLMFDLVLNHCSSEHPWFQEFLSGDQARENYFITQWTPENAPWIANYVKRARNLPLLCPHKMKSGETAHVWSTYHRDLPDLNWSEPAILLEWLEILFDSVAKGCRAVRLDAFAYVIKRAQTSCVNLSECKVLMCLLQDCLVAVGAAERVAVLPSITNVTQTENFEYLLHGASLVYHLPLSSLLLHTLYSADARVLRNWISQLQTPPLGKALLNVSASHDGVGLSWSAAILGKEKLVHLISCARERGGIIQYRRPTESSSDEDATPWEINITYFAACGLTPDERVSIGPSADYVHVDRLVATQAVVMGLQGVPSMYFSVLLGGENDWNHVSAIRAASERGQIDPDAVCMERAINRQRFDLDWWKSQTDQVGSSPRAYLLMKLQQLLNVRKRVAAFHPSAEQKVLSHSKLPDSLLVLLRMAVRLPGEIEPSDSNCEPSVVCVTNFGSSPVEIDGITALELFGSFSRNDPRLHQLQDDRSLQIFFKDLLGFDPNRSDLNVASLPDPASCGTLVDIRTGLRLKPYQTMWLVPTDPSSVANEPILFTLNNSAPIGLQKFATDAKQAVVGLIARSPIEDSPASRLGLPISAKLAHFLAVPLSSPESKGLLDQYHHKAKIIHLIRHGESLHKIWALHNAKCVCYDNTLPDKQDALILMQQQGVKDACPYLDPISFDAPCTLAGIQSALSALQIPQEYGNIEAIYAANSMRTLETAVKLRIAQNLQDSARVIAVEELRAMVSPHLHSKRCSTSILKILFPQVDFSAVNHDEDEIWHSCVIDGLQRRHECRESLDLRISELFKRLFNVPERNIALVGHFTTFWLMQALGSDGRIFGPRVSGSDPDRPILEIRGGGSLMFDLGQVVSLVVFPVDD